MTDRASDRAIGRASERAKRPSERLSDAMTRAPEVCLTPLLLRWIGLFKASLSTEGGIFEATVGFFECSGRCQLNFEGFRQF